MPECNISRLFLARQCKRLLLINQRFITSMTYMTISCIYIAALKTHWSINAYCSRLLPPGPCLPAWRDARHLICLTLMPSMSSTLNALRTAHARAIRRVTSRVYLLLTTTHDDIWWYSRSTDPHGVRIDFKDESSQNDAWRQWILTWILARRTLTMHQSDIWRGHGADLF